MALSLDASSPAHLNKESPVSMAPAAASPKFSPKSEERFWSALRNRVDSLLEKRSKASEVSSETVSDGGSNHQAKRLKEDSMLFLRGFDSVAFSLSQLTSNLETALQGARQLAKPPTPGGKVEESYKGEEENEGEKRVVKRKFEHLDCSSDQEGCLSENESEGNQVSGQLKKAKNLAVSLATKAAVMARELKSVKANLYYIQERCALLEEENRGLRDGFPKTIRHEEDELVRLQMEALLAEKSRLANENANLMRENQCLHQLVEYHQFASQDLSASYDSRMLHGICLDFSSPLEPIEDDANALELSSPSSLESQL
ncbi:hypothetical protein Nepgr_027868 [Nepenthes gracilis]|uniref:Uncharacterized protein n=1 Tax=Nepenthes gracilis TaxID=150966 RepID=A0AAD3Y3D6_NEPGR|nr:hypothetical protein Nepgr_027868 [Nepenthes gracilis]